MPEQPRRPTIPGLPAGPGSPLGPGGPPNPSGLPGPGGQPNLGGTPAWLQERLFGQRAVFLTGTLDDAAATRAAAELMLLDATGPEPIQLYLNCPDGSLEAALTLIDTLDLLRAPVRAQCLGQLGGPPVGVLAVAGTRVAAPHASFRLGLPRTSFDGTPDQLASRGEQHLELVRRFRARLARATGQPAERIADDLRAGRHLDAAEARAYGLIDEVAAPKR
ncbi:MAG: ATP-dependent Clp protease proteolytic subunit [Chloroflexota bacterium]|nr:ATP-dependent Clp protease proteolytic subunit [Chloroflexota bacterium]